MCGLRGSSTTISAGLTFPPRIPFERALDFANKEKITDLLYPLFVHNIGSLLYHPQNSRQTNMVVHESQRRQLEVTSPTRTTQGPQPPALHHHHSMQAPAPSHMPNPSNALIPHPGSRPGLERAHTFPTPPSSASSLIPMSTQGSSYEWGSQSMSSGVQGSQPLSIETGIGSARSMPATPATTPPGNGIQSMQSYQSQSGYDSKPYYSAAPQSQPQYAPQQPLAQPSMTSFGQSLPPASYIKSEMGPPSVRASGGQTEAENGEVKSDRYSQGNGQVGHGSGEGEVVQEHDAEYMHDNNAAYNANRGSYTYTTNPSVGSLTGEHAHLSPEMTGSPHQNGSGRITPRTSGGAQPQWASGYNTPPRQAPTSSLYNIVSDSRTTANGTATDSYSATSNSTPAYSSSMNGTLGTKRLRDDDEDRIARPDSRGVDYDSKRRKTITEASVGGPVGGAPLALQPVKAGVMATRRR